ncbi:MAG TPA: ABC transporter permease [Blastocatellia bacterium]|nr:ABC transporter permease [Blastocatellia bacterium]
MSSALTNPVRSTPRPTHVGRIWSDKPLRWLFGAIAALSLVALLAGFIAPYDHRSQDRTAIKAPPTRLHFIDAEGRFHLRPFIYRSRLVDRTTWRYEEDTRWRYPLVFFVRGDRVELFPGVTTSLHLFGVGEAEPLTSAQREIHPLQMPTGSRGESPLATPEHPPLPPRLYLLGADHLGRDVFSRLLFGCRPSLIIALASGLGALIIGLVLGCLAGYYGGVVDALLMRLNELIESIPVIFFIFALRSALPLELSPDTALGMLVVIFVAISWTTVARITRGAVLSLAGQEFLLAARAVGASEGRILRCYILPHALTPALTQATLTVPAFLLAEATLSFLGVGISEPEPSWGNMLAAARDLSVLTAQPWMLSSGLALAATVALFIVTGHALRRALDPQRQTSAPEWL